MSENIKGGAAVLAIVSTLAWLAWGLPEERRQKAEKDRAESQRELDSRRDRAETLRLRIAELDRTSWEQDPKTRRERESLQWQLEDAERDVRAAEIWVENSQYPPGASVPFRSSAGKRR